MSYWLCDLTSYSIHPVSYYYKGAKGAVHICDWACKNRAYLHKLRMFKKWHFSFGLCLWYSCSVNCLCFIIDLWIRHKDFIVIVFVIQYCKLNFKNKAKLFVQICPIFAGPVTYTIFSFSSDVYYYVFLLKTLIHLMCMLTSNVPVHMWLIILQWLYMGISQGII